jgi:hypothetical protein
MSSLAPDAAKATFLKRSSDRAKLDAPSTRTIESVSRFFEPWGANRPIWCSSWLVNPPHNRSTYSRPQETISNALSVVDKPTTQDVIVQHAPDRVGHGSVIGWWHNETELLRVDQRRKLVAGGTYSRKSGPKMIEVSRPKRVVRFETSWRSAHTN